MEYLEGTTLEVYLKKNRQIAIEQRKKILRALLLGLRDMRQLRIVHRDIKT
jgi:serine/threonine protein kinase